MKEKGLALKSVPCVTTASKFVPFAQIHHYTCAKNTMTIPWYPFKHCFLETKLFICYSHKLHIKLKVSKNRIAINVEKKVSGVFSGLMRYFYLYIIVFRPTTMICWTVRIFVSQNYLQEIEDSVAFVETMILSNRPGTCFR